jgi:hypothetical protein
MKRNAWLLPLVFLLAGTAAYAGPIIAFSNFTENVVYGTDTFENSGGTVLSTVQFVGWSDELPADIAGEIAGDPAFPLPPHNVTNPLSDPAAITFIQSTVSQFALTTDLAFLTGPLPSVFLTSATPNVYIGSPSDVTLPESFLQTLFPGFVVTYPVSAYSLGTATYNTGALDTSINTLYEGTVTFDLFELDMVSQPAAATPEPSTLLLFGAGGLVLLLAAPRAGDRTGF